MRWVLAWRERRIKKYLTSHQELALNVLRTDPDLSSVVALQAAANTLDRKTMEFPFLTGMGQRGTFPGNTTLPKSTPYNLRKFSETPPARRAINAIADPLCELPWQIELMPPDDHDRGAALPKPTPVQHERILVATQMLRAPNREQAWRTFLEEVLEDMLVYGAGSIEIGRSRQRERPLYLWTTDTESIRINAHWDGDPRSFRYSQALGISGLGVAGHDTVNLRDQDLLYIRLNPRTNTPFGLGYLEVAFAAVNAFLGAFDFAEKLASNAAPNYIIALGEHATLDQVRRYQHYWENEIEGRGKPPIIGGGSSLSVLPLVAQGEDALKLKWQEMLLRLVAISFGLSPLKMGIERDVNRTTAEVTSGSDWDSIAPVAQAISAAITSRILHRELGWTDLRFVWQNQEGTAMQRAEVLGKRWAMDGMLVDEIREAYELPPLPEGRGQFTKSEYEQRAKALYAPASVLPPTEDPNPKEALHIEKHLRNRAS